MPVVASNGTVISATEIQWTCKMYSGMYLYCTYVKGTEASVGIEFTITDDSEPTSGAFSVIEIAPTTNVISKYAVVINATINAVIPVEIPEGSDKINAIVTFNTPAGSPGTITIFGTMKNIYA